MMALSKSMTPLLTLAVTVSLAAFIKIAMTKRNRAESEYGHSSSLFALCRSTLNTISGSFHKAFGDRMAPKSKAFHDILVRGEFFTISDEEVLRLVYEEFDYEIDRLKEAYSIRDPDVTLPKSKSPSQIIYNGKNYDEVNRTLVGVLALRWIKAGSYDQFVGSQPEPVKATRESFNWIQNVFQDGLKSPTDLYALVMSIVINDLGKDPKLAEDYQKETGEDISGENHDMILLKAVRRDMVKCLYRLNREHKADVLRGMELGAEFNFGQLAQAENTPACVSGLKDMRGHVRSFDVRFMEQLLDIAGASGHMDWTCAKKLIEPIFQSYRNVHDVAMGIISGDMELRDGYDIILIRRGELLEETGFRPLSVKQPDQRALMRLLCMGGAANAETAELYDDALSSLEKETEDTLVAKLNLDGTVAEPAVQPTYMPAMLARGIGSTLTGSAQEKKKALQSMLRYLARVLTVTQKPKEPIIVIERSVMGVLKDVVGGEEFKANPDILDKISVPKDAVAKMGQIGG